MVDTNEIVSVAGMKQRRELQHENTEICPCVYDISIDDLLLKMLCKVAKNANVVARKKYKTIMLIR